MAQVSIQKLTRNPLVLLGGVVIIGGIAYWAWQNGWLNWLFGNPVLPPPPPTGPLPPPPPGTGDVVYLWANDGFGLIGIHQIKNKATGTVMGNVQYEQDVFGLVSGTVYQYVSNGSFSARLRTGWSPWPEKPVNTRAVDLYINGVKQTTPSGIGFEGAVQGDTNGVAFEFSLI